MNYLFLFFFLPFHTGAPAAAEGLAMPATVASDPVPAAIRTLTLQDCIGIALQNSTTVLKGNNDIAIAGTQVLAAYGQYLPNVQAAGGYNYDLGNNFYASTGPYLAYTARSAYNYQLTRRINIFTGFFNYSSFKAAKLNKNVAELTLERAKEAVEVDITEEDLQVVRVRKP